MGDREFLIWMHRRLTEIHGEHELSGYMHRFRMIIYNTPGFRISPRTTFNSIDELINTLNEQAEEQNEHE